MNEINKYMNHILIVDDDLGIVTALKEFLYLSGYYVSVALSGEEAIKILKKQDVTVVITDILMPGMDGLELTDIIKKDFKACVIVMTAFCEDYNYVDVIGKGASDFIFKPIRFDELLLRLKRVLNEIQQDKTQLKMIRTLKRLAITDGLTGLYNSRHFYEQLKKEIDRTKRYRHALSLLLLDIDHFKNYNDSYGHLEGDRVLVILCETIIKSLRKMDTAYRYGGEEFTVILPETSRKEAFVVAERIRESLKNINFEPVSGVSCKITISIGITEYILEEDSSVLVKRADEAMYRSKENGRNTISVL